MPILTGEARVAGVLGWPIAHSRSPRLHGFWLERFRIDGAYVPIPARPEAFATVVHGLHAAGFVGANVTVPHKQAAFALCDVVEETARRAGAVNLLTFRDGKIRGENTDGFGFVANLRAHGVDPSAGPALLFGGGGSARSVAAALQAEGTQVAIAARRPEQAEALAAIFGLQVVPWAERERALADHALLVNTTSAGMVHNLPLALDLARAAPSATVVDIVYAPLQTPLLRDARAAGLRTVGGLGMLLHQARPAFHAWFGVDPPVDDELYRFVAADLL
ncbi:MAG: shikimate dehydrogenase [Acidisphaera sp.]|nr:shikimate dehydrogenase [Acidisphaera sp.]